MVLPVIIGAVLILAGAVLCFLPGTGFLAAGQFIGIAMILYGANGLIQAVFRRSFRGDFFFALFSVFAGAFLLFDPLLRFMTDAFVMFFAAGWLIFLGAAQITVSVSAKKAFRTHWWFLLIAGILDVFLGALFIIDPLVGILAVGLMIGLCFVDTGLGMILCGLAFRE